MADIEEKTVVRSVPALLGKHQGQNAYLIQLSAKNAAVVGQMFKLGSNEVVLGRSAESTLQVEDDGISRKHCKLCLGPTGRYQLVDLGSTNGTFLNGSKVDVATLADGDKIQIGSNTVLKFSLQDELEEEYQRSIYESATRDGLTKLFNKKYFLDSLAKEFAYSQRHRVPLSLVMMDVDHFKKINDTYGHPAGDFVLAKVAQKLAETIREEDILARYGGEEFALLLRECGEAKALVCAERCRKAIELTDMAFAGAKIPVSISAGVTTALDSTFDKPEEVVAAADKYLYRAKQGGRNRVEGSSLSGP